MVDGRLDQDLIGFNPLPSEGTGLRRKKGFDVNRINSKNATAISDCILRALAFNGGGIFRPHTATAAPNIDKIKTQSSIEPSWLPQTPLTLYSKGLSEWLLLYTSRSEKSDITNA